MSDRQFEINNDIDPDINFFDSYDFESKYFSVGDYSEAYTSNSNPFTIVNFNIRSYNANSDCFFAHFRTLPEVLILTETWFSPTNFVNLPQYNSFHVLEPQVDQVVSLFLLVINSDLSRLMNFRLLMSLLKFALCVCILMVCL